MAPKRVLIIEDAETLAVFMRRQLLETAEPFEVERACGATGVSDEEYDLVVAKLSVDNGQGPKGLWAALGAECGLHPLQVSPATRGDSEPSAPHEEAIPSQPHRGMDFDGVRVLSVLVADIEQSTPLTRCLGPQRMLEFLKLFYLEMIRAVGDAGCTKQYAGDQVLAVFEDPTEAVRTALRMQTAFTALCAQHLRGLPVRPGLGIGIATGMVAGDADQFRHVLAGAPVIAAARLSGLSKGNGGILIDETTHRALRGSVTSLRQAKPRHIKGFETPLQLYRVVEDNPTLPSVRQPQLLATAGMAT
ncbi:MAG: adenylate/guanylate cyclase domain-containing protein [Chloroflexi bacterium]|nr:adenylate/guanylate cyclase domain-containing protein [Chloroflexota bacterium]